MSKSPNLPIADRVRLEYLRRMLTYARPAGSRTVSIFGETFLRPTGARRDAHGNWIKVIGDSPILWSSHTDTVHRYGGRQAVCLSRRGRLYLPEGAQGACLGADDTAGVFVMLAMISARVPGVYVFHDAEEIGSLGAQGLIEDSPEWLRSITHAIAFDRRGTRDVITHQSGRRTMSDECALAIADRIGLEYAPSANGVYTDTEAYASTIAECSNLSVGYEGAHTPRETLDGYHVLALIERMIEGARHWRDLPVARVPVAKVDRWAYLDDMWPDDVDSPRAYLDSPEGARTIDDDYLTPEWREILDALRNARPRRLF